MNPHTTTLALPDTVKQLNIYDLYRGIQNKKLKRHATYGVVLAKCHAFIKRAADAELFMTMFVVPEFIVGVPLYDINQCTAYVIAQLRSNGFVVMYYYPKTLFVSWELDKPDDSRTRPPPKPKAPPRAADGASLSPQDPVFEIVQPMYQTPEWDSRPAIPPPYSDVVMAPPQSANKTTAFTTKFKPSGKFVLNLL